MSEEVGCGIGPLASALEQGWLPQQLATRFDNLQPRALQDELGGGRWPQGEAAAF